MNRREDFLHRLKEADVRFELVDNGNGSVTTKVEYRPDNKETWMKDTLAVQGLIYHFSNRGWITGDNYMYVMQDEHTFRFVEEGGDQ